jgi:hypothetical protein
MVFLGLLRLLSGDIGAAPEADFMKPLRPKFTGKTAVTSL